MIRFAWMFLFLAGAFADAQANPLDALRKTAEKASADWEALAKGLEQKISTLLPCDPKSRAAVEEVSHASETRLLALSTYLKAAAAEAKADTEAAKRVLAAQAALSGGWNTERAEADQERTAIEAQIADLKESMRKRGSLAGAEQVLSEIANMVKARGEKADEQAARKDTFEAMLGSLVAAYHDRQAALENESALLDAETVKWNAYYSARVSRAVTECAIINPAAPRKRTP
jgi:DNA repair exonuclease SbcCD ATPase subunit